MNKTQINYLRGLAAAGAGCRRGQSLIADDMYEHEAIGQKVGRGYAYEQADIEKCIRLLQFNGLSLVASSDSSRGAADAGITEKRALNAPRLGDLAVRALTPSCHFDGEPISNRLPGYLVIKPGDLEKFDFDAFLVIENLETFAQIERYRWLFDSDTGFVNEKVIPSPKARIMAIFMGDHVFKESTVRETLALAEKPVWSFPDLDPAGLGKAMSLAHLQGLAFPWFDKERLESQLIKMKRFDLYENQVLQWENSLKSADLPDIKKSWSMIFANKKGLQQESLRDF